jgi:hypothetical protein
VKNEEVLHTVKKKRNILHTIRGRKATWIGYSLRRNCLLKLVIEGKIRDGKQNKKTYAATGWPQGNEKILEVERGSTRSHCGELALEDSMDLS